MWIASEDYCGYDFGGVMVDNTVVDQFDLCSNTDTSGWVRRTVDLGAYAGQNVALQIRAETDDLYNSNLFVDDVALTNAAGTFYRSAVQHAGLGLEIGAKPTANLVRSAVPAAPEGRVWTPSAAAKE
jgi:hypothetical protein